MGQMSDYDKWLMTHDYDLWISLAVEDGWFPEDDEEEVDENELYQQMKDDEGCL